MVCVVLDINIKVFEGYFDFLSILCSNFQLYFTEYKVIM